MQRVRITLPKRGNQSYQNLDLLHDALIEGMDAAGASSAQLVGERAAAWNFAALGWHGREMNQVHTLVLSTADPQLAEVFMRLKPEHIRKTQRATGEQVDFSCASLQAESDPIVSGMQHLSVLMLSPLAIRQRGSKKWHHNIREVDLSAAINFRLSRLAGRSIQLEVQPDALYLRANPEHALLVPVKRFSNGKKAFVIGMNVPLVISGSEEDLRLAWYTGIGEKNRNGFGCIGLAEQGVGR